MTQPHTPWPFGLIYDPTSPIKPTPKRTGFKRGGFGANNGTIPGMGKTVPMPGVDTPVNRKFNPAIK